MNILVTGGLGYIGSHAVVELIKCGHTAIILDNCSNSYIKNLNAIRSITQSEVIFYYGDIKDALLLDRIFNENHIDAVMHFAGLKSVAQSEQNPIAYYNANVAGSAVLFDVMSKNNVKKIIFSSSATVYGLPDLLPIPETHNTNPYNIYGKTKHIVEQMLFDMFNADNSWSIHVLRYFNPIGSHESGLIGDNPKTKAENIMPAIANVISKKQNVFNVYGIDYLSKDGSAVRDYIHINDLVSGHIACLKRIDHNEYNVINLGSGSGYTVLELLNAFEVATGINVPYDIKPNRCGDIPNIYAKIDKAELLLGWKPKLSLIDMCLDSYRFIQKRIDN